VIVVVWTRGAFGVYTQAVANTRVVGAVIANMVNTLHSAAGVDFGNVHLVGHSLGAQVCGYAGERRHFEIQDGHLDQQGFFVARHKFCYSTLKRSSVQNFMLVSPFA
jgi:pimeloyl-ACP methyl ester carboxylesterase